ncbi:unnamed protein product [Lactuca virosa]|uniref:F-box domain-containing protein n=1 Tax=Lactuca virosa TaxID=75947 RepID=A0AAU9PCV8_9ASTR|nr:unnamed protein product [Lactuca virosa]
MAKTRSMTRNQKNHDDASSSSRKRPESCASWSDFDHNLLAFLVLMQLGVVDYLSFGGVCKSWRSLAVSNRNMFMGTRPPISISSICCHAYENTYYLVDFEGRKLKIPPPPILLMLRVYD